MDSSNNKDQIRRLATEPKPFGPAFTEEEANQAAFYEVWGSSFNDPGPDFCEFKLLDKDKNIIKTKRIAGY